jgi:hypothetical protein
VFIIQHVGSVDNSNCLISERTNIVLGDAVDNRRYTCWEYGENSGSCGQYQQRNSAGQVIDGTDYLVVNRTGRCYEQRPSIRRPSGLLLGTGRSYVHRPSIRPSLRSGLLGTGRSQVPWLPERQRQPITPSGSERRYRGAFVNRRQQTPPTTPPNIKLDCAFSLLAPRV